MACFLGFSARFMVFYVKLIIISNNVRPRVRAQARAFLLPYLFFKILLILLLLWAVEMWITFCKNQYIVALWVDNHHILWFLAKFCAPKLWITMWITRQVIHISTFSLWITFLKHCSKT